MSDSYCSHRQRFRIALTVALWATALGAAFAVLTTLGSILGPDVSIIVAAAVVLAGLAGIGLTIEGRLPLLPCRPRFVRCACGVAADDRAARRDHDP